MIQRTTGVPAGTRVLPRGCARIVALASVVMPAAWPVSTACAVAYVSPAAIDAVLHSPSIFGLRETGSQQIQLKSGQGLSVKSSNTVRGAH